MKHLKTYNLYERVSKDSKLFESVSNNLTHILYEINDETDETYWKANCWPDSQDGKWVVVIQTVDSPDEPEEEGLTPPPSVIETIKRAIEFMDGEGFTNYEITFNNEYDDQYEEINLEEVSDLDVWSNNFIRIDFMKIDIEDIKSKLKDFCHDFEEKDCVCDIYAYPGKPGKPLISFIDIDIDRRIKIDSKMFPDWFIERCKEIESYMDSEGFNTKTSVKYPIRIQPMNKTVRIQDWEDKESIDSLTEEKYLVDEVRLYFEPK
jgi:hypothetical protein